jgi:transposase
LKSNAVAAVLMEVAMRTLRLTALLVACSLAAACGKGPAEAALKAADQALEAARPEIEKYVPEEFTALSGAAKAAREKFDQGDYKAALAAAQDLPGKVQAAAAAAAAKKEALTQTWGALQASVPAMVEALKNRVTQLVSMKKLPKGMDATQLGAAKNELDAITQAWGEASAAFQAGNLLQAVDKANAVQTRVAAAMTSVGLSASPAPPAK